MVDVAVIVAPLSSDMIIIPVGDLLKQSKESNGMSAANSLVILFGFVEVGVNVREEECIAVWS
jgi:hypothetical protein